MEPIELALLRWVYLGINFREDSSNYEKIVEGKAEKLINIDAEIPFSIPPSWQWTRLGDVCDVRDGTHDSPKYVSKGFPLITSKNLLHNTLDFSNIKLISKDDYLKINERSSVDEGDILFAMIGSIGNPVIVKKTCLFAIKNVALFKTTHIELFEKKYLYYFLIFVQDIMKKIATGGVQPFVSLSFLRKYIFPLPPLKEQQRIVEKVEELFSLIDEIDKNREELKGLGELSKSKILDLAIRGKLVAQDENEESADVLLEKIRTEKQSLVKAKKIKADKKQSQIIKSHNDFYELHPDGTKTALTDLPFPLPPNWTWTNLDGICEYIQRGKSPKYSEEKEIPVIAQKCVQWTGFSIEKAKFIQPDTIDSYAEERFLINGDLLWNSTGLGTVGRIAIYYKNKNPYNIAVADSHVTIVRTFKDFIDFKYLFMWLSSPEVQVNIESKTEGSTKQKELYTSTIKNHLFPLPPLAEQKRIVAKVEELLSIVEGLKI